MGLKDLGKSLLSKTFSVESSTTAAVSRRLVKEGRKLLALEPDWAEGESDQKKLLKILDGLETVLASIDGRLVLGLLGGTGVGKSTLISALAGEPISKASVLRPATNRPVVYRHGSFPPLTDFGGLEIVHQLESLKGVAIVDFPDFDSLETANHRLVLDSLGALDLVIWVTDHNKYADRRLYEVMRLANQVTGSAYQVVALNKIDELLAKEGGAEALKDVLSSLGDQLFEYGSWEGAAPWPISAAVSLANPGERDAGGLSPLRDLLDSLADAKMRRSVEMGNLETRNLAFKESLAQAACPERWLEQLNALKNLAGILRPLRAIEGDLASLNILRHLYIAPRMERIRKKTTGLLSIFTDSWAFIVGGLRRSAAAGLPPAAPAPAAPSLVLHLLGRGEDLRFINSAYEPLNGEDLANRSEAVLEKALNDHFYMAKDPKPSAWILDLWPLVLALLLIWAESGGQFGGPASIAAAALRSAAPWCVFSLIGGIALTNFIWFRVRRRLEVFFQKALDQARADLLTLADDQLAGKIRLAIEHQTDSLDQLDEIQAAIGD